MANSYSSGDFSSLDIKNVTTLNNEIYSFFWRIDQFGEFMDRKYEFSSPVFSSNLNEEIKWKIIAYSQDLYPEGQHLSLRLLKASKDNKSVAMKYEIAIIDLNGKYVSQKIREHVFRQYMDYDESAVVSIYKIKSLNLLGSGNLTVCCKMDLLVSKIPEDLSIPEKNEIPSTCSVTKPLESERKAIKVEKDKFIRLSAQIRKAAGESFKTNKSLEALSDDFKKLYMNSHQSDIIIRVDDGEVRAHKAIITSRSDYFRKECTSHGNSEMRIAGVKSIILDAVLYYMYTGQLRQLTYELAIDLLKVTNIFNLPQLEELIENFLETQINTNNVIDIFEISNGLGMEALKTSALKFISTNHLEVTKTEKWSRMMKSNPRAAGEIFLTIAAFQNKKYYSS